MMKMIFSSQHYQESEACVRLPKNYHFMQPALLVTDVCSHFTLFRKRGKDITTVVPFVP